MVGTPIAQARTVTMTNVSQPQTIHVIGGGLAGTEAAWQIAQAGIPVVLHEMRPLVKSPAHHSENLAELVCSNSFGAQLIESPTIIGLAASKKLMYSSPVNDLKSVARASVVKGPVVRTTTPSRGIS